MAHESYYPAAWDTRSERFHDACYELGVQLQKKIRQYEQQRMYLTAECLQAEWDEADLCSSSWEECYKRLNALNERY